MEAAIGIGDDVIATGMAKGAAARGERIAFGDGRTIRWGPYSEMIFRNNPNVARSTNEHPLSWISYYKGQRIYNRDAGGRWAWNYSFKAVPGEFFFDADECLFAKDDSLILLEPNVPNKPSAPNKQWPIERWEKLTQALTAKGFRVTQFEYPAIKHRVAPTIKTLNFRLAAALLKSARLAILPEGGLHHAAAAVGLPAVVLFGGYVPPAVLGYDVHVNLTGGAEACGKYTRCQHCVEAMDRISVDEVLSAVEKLLCH